MREIPRTVVIATHNRPVELRRCVEAIALQVDLIVVVDNASDPPVDGKDLYDNAICHSGAGIITMDDPEQPPNLSRLWNVGIARARRFWHEQRKHSRWDVAVLNDDAVPPPGWFNAVAGAMREEGADAASSDPFDRMMLGETRKLDGTYPPGVETRLAGWAMMLRGEWEGARFDERLRWWYGDDELSLRARQAGGLVHVGGYPVPNTGANTSTVGALAEQAGRDRATFIEITGRQPW